MCLISPITPRKKPSKKSSSKASGSGSTSTSQLAARITNNATTSHSHTVELPTSHLPPYIFHKAQGETPEVQITPATTNPPSPFQYLDQAGVYSATTTAVPGWGPSASTSLSNRAHRSTVLSDIDFVQTLSSKLAPPAPASPKEKAPSEAEKKIQAELQRLADIMTKKERDDEIAAAVAKGKAEGKAEMAKKEKDTDALKPKDQKPSCNSGSCGCCSDNSGSRRAEDQDGFVFHLHTHQDGVPVGNGGVGNGGLGYVDASAGGLYERQSSSVSDTAMGYARRVMDRMRRIEARTAFLETELEMGWERDMERERRRCWERDRERERYPGSAWGRGNF